MWEFLGSLVTFLFIFFCWYLQDILNWRLKYIQAKHKAEIERRKELDLLEEKAHRRLQEQVALYDKDKQ